LWFKITIRNFCPIEQGIPRTSDNIAVIYNTMVEVCVQDKNLPMGEMTLDKVSTFLREHEHNVKFFKALCLAHLHLEYEINQ
jgi:hypothetical protein